MTVKGLNDLIKKFNCTELCHISHFKGKRIAVDGSMFLYRYFCPVWKEYVCRLHDFSQGDPQPESVTEKWLRNMLSRLLFYLDNGITPVIVFEDGTNPHKQAVRDRKKSQQEELRQRIEAAKQQQQWDVVRKLYCETRPLPILSVPAIFQGLGLPVFVTSDEGERLCSSLAIEGYVTAVWSRDSDNLPYGCPLLLTDEGEKKYGNVRITPLARVLDSLQLTLRQLIDMSIVAGCDLNNYVGIPGVGIAGAYELIRKYGYIEQLAELHYDVGCSKYQLCRELFCYKPVRDLVKEGETLTVSLELLAEQGRELLVPYKLDNSVELFVRAYKQILGC